MPTDFSHLDDTGGISMVDVGAKRSTSREAVALATVRMSPETLRKLIDQALPKGDVLTTAKIAGVLAAKQTPNLIPLAHPLAIRSGACPFALHRTDGTDEGNSSGRRDRQRGRTREGSTERRPGAAEWHAQ